MTVILAQVSMDRVTGLPEDRVVNTWHFATPGPLAPQPSDLDRIKMLLTDWYTTPTANGSKVVDFLSPFLTSPMKIKYYNQDVPKPRPPLREDTIAWVPVAGQSLPAECAIVLSMRSAPPAGAPQRQFRGRIYLGPLRSDVMANSIGDVGIKSLTTVCMAQASTRMILGSQIPGATWVTYSATRKGLGLPTTFAPVSAGFIDSAFDSQRRRGRTAEARVIY